jgi:hypothetical protein
VAHPVVVVVVVHPAAELRGQPVGRADRRSWSAAPAAARQLAVAHRAVVVVVAPPPQEDVTDGNHPR